MAINDGCYTCKHLETRTDELGWFDITCMKRQTLRLEDMGACAGAWFGDVLVQVKNCSEWEKK